MYEREMKILKEKEIKLIEEIRDFTEEIRDFTKAMYEMRTDEIITKAEKNNNFNN